MKPKIGNMITIKNKEYGSNINLASIYNCMAKQRILDIAKKLDLYVSPNLKKEVTARRVAEEVLSAPVNVMCSFCKAEHQLLEEFVTAGANAYVVRKIRKTPYKLQKFGLVLTYEDDAKGEWHMLMPDSVRDSLADFVPQFMNYINAGQRIPSAKEIRMRMALHRFLNGEG